MKILKFSERIFNDLFNWIVLRRNNVTYGSNLKINGRLYIRNSGQIVMGNNVTINSGRRFSPIGGADQTRLIVKGKLFIGDNVGISNSNVYCAKEINIHNDTIIGSSCNLWDTNFHSLKYKDRIYGDDIPTLGAINIYSGCFVGAHSILLKGTNLPKHTIVPAGTITNKRDIT